MKVSSDRTKLTTIDGLLLAGAVTLADGTRFSDFTPLASSAGPTNDVNGTQVNAPVAFGVFPFPTRRTKVWPAAKLTCVE